MDCLEHTNLPIGFVVSSIVLTTSISPSHKMSPEHALGSVISQHRDGRLIRGLLIRVRSCGPVEKILLVTDGLASYKSQALKIFRKALHTGKVGRPKLALAEGIMIARVLKRYQRRRVVEVLRQVIVGSQAT